MAETKADALKLQPRDLVLLRGLFESRVMTTDHAAALYFDGKGEAAKKRLQKLKSAGFIAERPRRTFEPSGRSFCSRDAAHTRHPVVLRRRMGRHLGR